VWPRTPWARSRWWPPSQSSLTPPTGGERDKPPHGEKKQKALSTG